MKVYNNIFEFKGGKNIVLTTGTFDGVHKGHKKILNNLKEVSKSINGETVVLTFFPHPRMILNPKLDLKLINTMEEKVELLRNEGIDHLIIHPFSKDFANTTSEDFVFKIIEKQLRTKKLVIGYDHQFGKDRSGSFEFLKQNESRFSFDVQEISALDINETNVSSTKIRNALLEGDISTANKYLGRPFSFRGNIVGGNKLGSKINFPTANIKITEHYKIIPKIGVYAVNVKHGNEILNGMLNIGTKPTVSDTTKLSIEVNIFDFNKDIYGKVIEVEIIQRIRDEKKFDSIDDLRTQLSLDKKHTQTILCD